MSNRQDVIFAVFIIGVVMMLIVPLPTTLIDILVGLSLSFAVILLMVAVYLDSPLKFSSFPSILLVTTLFRLVLSISTTRLILLQADAGEIISTFGNFVVGGNLVVGLVIFLILTIVNFLVVTKGAERIAEVSARFSLDAMPGKQMSIDSDMRAGVLSPEKARVQRAAVQDESRLFGSMDGAMKFVKGDAIAGIIIVFVNLLGGLAIGMLQRGMSFSTAIETYSILSIGDGLVNQIPSIIIALTAGMIVTRVGGSAQSAAGKTSDVAKDIGNQISAQPRALIIAASMLLLFALIPGFPSITLVGLAAVFGLPSYFALRRIQGKRTRSQGGQDAPPAQDQTTASGELVSATSKMIYAPTCPILVEFSSALAQQTAIDRRKSALMKVRFSVYFQLGVSIPTIDLRIGSGLPLEGYRILLDEIPASDGLLKHNKQLSTADPDVMSSFDVACEESSLLFSGKKTYWVENSNAEKVRSNGYALYNHEAITQQHLQEVIIKNIGQFMGIEEAQRIMDTMEKDYPDLIKEAERVLPVQSIAEILRRLVCEYVSIRDLRVIFTALVGWSDREKDVILLTEHVRAALSRQISFQYSSGQNVLSSFIIGGDIEDSLRNAIRQTSSASYLALDPTMSKKIIDEIKNATAQERACGAKMVLLTSMDVRRYLRRLIEPSMPYLPVLSYMEVTPDMTVQPLGHITLEQQ